LRCLKLIPKKAAGKSRSELEAEFLAGFDADSRIHDQDLLDLARVSYRLSDDDNALIHRSALGAPVTAYA